MKKIIAMLSAFAIVAAYTTAFAEINIEDIADKSVEKHSMADNYDLSLLEKNENNEYILYKQNGYEYDECLVDISGAYKDLYFISIYSKDDIKGYNDESFLEFFADKIVNDDTTVDVFNIYKNGEFSRIHFKYEDFAVIQNYDAERENKMVAVLNEAGVDSIYDVYSFSWTSNIPYSKRSDGTIKYKVITCSAMYFDTDVGKMVIPYYAATSNLEEYKIYTSSEFLSEMAAIYDEIKPQDEIIQSEIITVNEDGDEEKEIYTTYPIYEEIESDTEEDNDQTDDITDDIQVQDDDKTKETGEDVKDAVKEDEKDSEPGKEPLKNWVDVKIDGKEIAFEDQQPLIENDRVLVPMRKIFEELGAEIEWDEETQTVTATIGDTVITLQIGKNEITKNGVTTEIDTEAQLVNDRTLVPLRAVSESCGNTVTWNAETKTVEITK